LLLIRTHSLLAVAVPVLVLLAGTPRPAAGQSWSTPEDGGTLRIAIVKPNLVNETNLALFRTAVFADFCQPLGGRLQLELEVAWASSRILDSPYHTGEWLESRVETKLGPRHSSFGNPRIGIRLFLPDGISWSAGLRPISNLPGGGPWGWDRDQLTHSRLERLDAFRDGRRVFDFGTGIRIPDSATALLHLGTSIILVRAVDGGIFTENENQYMLRAQLRIPVGRATAVTLGGIQRDNLYGMSWKHLMVSGMREVWVGLTAPFLGIPVTVELSRLQMEWGFVNRYVLSLGARIFSW
jgi:hypothetical protein